MSDEPEDTCPDCGGTEAEHTISLGMMRADWAHEFASILLEKADPEYMSEDDEQALVGRAVRIADGLMERLFDGLHRQDESDDDAPGAESN